MLPLLPFRVSNFSELIFYKFILSYDQFSENFVLGAGHTQCKTGCRIGQKLDLNLSNIKKLVSLFEYKYSEKLKAYFKK